MSRSLRSFLYLVAAVKLAMTGAVVWFLLLPMLEYDLQTPVTLIVLAFIGGVGLWVGVLFQRNFRLR